MKKILPLVVALALLLTSCSLGNLGVGKILFATNDREKANESFEKVISAIENQDNDALRSLFSTHVLRDTQDWDRSANELFSYFQGTLVSYDDWNGHEVSSGINDDGSGRCWKTLHSTYDVKTTQDEYRFAIELVLVDTEDADNVGIRSLYVIKLADDTDPTFAYRGDGKNTPGIHINKKNVIPV